MLHNRFLLQDLELWEDDFIKYGCENGSLVINRNKNMKTVSYKCLDDGTYDTPKGKEEGDPWPECTLKPVDPSNFTTTKFSHLNGNNSEIMHIT